MYQSGQYLRVADDSMSAGVLLCELMCHLGCLRQDRGVCVVEQLRQVREVACDQLSIVLRWRAAH